MCFLQSAIALGLQFSRPRSCSLPSACLRFFHYRKSLVVLRDPDKVHPDPETGKKQHPTHLGTMSFLFDSSLTVAASLHSPVFSISRKSTAVESVTLSVYHKYYSLIDRKLSTPKEMIKTVVGHRGVIGQ